MEGIDLAKGEEVLATTRRSWIALVPSLISVIFWGIGFSVGIYYLMGFCAELAGADGTQNWEVLFDIFAYVPIALAVLSSVLRFVGRIVAIRSDYLVLTNKRLYGRRGFIAKSTYDTMLDKIDTVRVVNTFFGRICHYASLEIVSPASTRIVRGNTVYEQYAYIVNTEEFRKAVIAAIEKTKTDGQTPQRA